MHVVLVGDTIIDEYHYVSALGKPSKENIVATLSKSREQFAGGVLRRGQPRGELLQVGRDRHRFSAATTIRRNSSRRFIYDRTSN